MLVFYKFANICKFNFCYSPFAFNQLIGKLALMITPPFLKKGDKIGIVAPARWVTPEEIEAALKVFESWGLEVVRAENLYKQHRQFGGTDDQRTADMQAMLDNDDIRAIVCARGGYGTVRIIDKLDFRKFAGKPKWIAGYSDVTALHSHIESQYGIETLHAPMPFSFNNDNDSIASFESLRRALFGGNLSYETEAGRFSGKGMAQAPITGGNLSMLYSISGSASECDTAGKILFIEDLDEYLYHVDRMMQQLKRSGKLANLAGLIVGSMSKMRDNQVPFGKTAQEIIAEAVKEYDYPVLFDFPAGHDALNQTLILGRTVNLEVGEKAKLIFLQPSQGKFKKAARLSLLKSIGFTFLLFAAIYLLYYFVINLLL
jgi:muramoyltetrapeptide carboxypeptidase